MARNNNIENNDDIKYSRKKFRDNDKPTSFVVNLEELSTGVKSDFTFVQSINFSNNILCYYITK